MGGLEVKGVDGEWIHAEPIKKAKTKSQSNSMKKAMNESQTKSTMKVKTEAHSKLIKECEAGALTKSKAAATSTGKKIKNVELPIFFVKFCDS